MGTAAASAGAAGPSEGLRDNITGLSPAILQINPENSTTSLLRSKIAYNAGVTEA